MASTWPSSSGVVPRVTAAAWVRAGNLTLEDGSAFDELRAALDRLQSVRATEGDRARCTLTAIPANSGDRQAVWHDVSTLIAENGWELHGLRQDPGHLDEVFRQITQGAVA